MHNGNDAGSPVALLTDVVTDTRAFYDDSLGLVSYSPTLGGYCLVQLDGTTHLRSAQNRGNRFTLDLQRAGGWIMHDSLFENALYLLNKNAGTFGDLVIDTGVTADMTNLLVRCSDRYLEVISGTLSARPLDLSTSAATEATLTNAGTGRPTVSRTKAANVVALVYPNGPIVYYDVVARAQAQGSANIGANDGAWYSVKHDIFIAIASHAVKVFANAVKPASLSNPSAVDSIVQGRVSKVRVRLLGANADPCVGELIDWSITAGLGALASTQSTTDEDGYAYNEFIGPLTGGSGSPFGSVTIQAQFLGA